MDTENTANTAPQQPAQPQPGDGEKHAFATEVQQILHLMVHSLYSKREVFLRELISNASDALDTARFLALTDPEIKRSEEPSIDLLLDKDAHTLTITDDGIGMSRQEVIDNIGTIARSGSAALLKRMREQAAQGEGDKGSLELIGQFGVGFYSAFMVADRVELTTLSARPGAEAVHWSSTGDGTYTVRPGQRFHPGTTILLHLKDDALEFLEEWRVEQIVKNYSNYVKWPVNLKGRRLNQSTVLWAKRPAEVTAEEHKQFYHELMGGFSAEEEPLTRLHIQLDAPYQFQAIVYVPAQAPLDFMMDQNKRRGMQLYVRRVFILDHAEELLPPYLRFLRGVVDSDDLPLNVSREILQKNQVIATIQKQLVKKTLEELKRLKDSEADKYRKFWDEFGPSLKEGLFTDSPNRDKLADLMLSGSLKTPAEQRISLGEYVAAMPEGQTEIYYITGPSRQAVEESPHLEALRKRGLDVLLLTDAIDEWVVQGLTEYQGKQLRAINKGDFELPKVAAKEEGAAEQPADKPSAEEELLVGGLVAHLRVRFQDLVKEVKLTSRLEESPACLVAGAGDMGRNLEQILMRSGRKVPESKPILEVNPKSAFVRNLARLVRDAPHAEDTEKYCDLLLELAYVGQGTVRRPAQLLGSLSQLLAKVTA